MNSSRCSFYLLINGEIFVTCQDELLWASAWLYRATRDRKYLDFLQNNQGGSSNMFSWDNKYSGAQMLATQVSHHIPKPQSIIQ
jgi:hypothetical protein